MQVAGAIRSQSWVVVVWGEALLVLADTGDPADAGQDRMQNSKGGGGLVLHVMKLEKTS